MKYFKNDELVRKYGVSDKTVRNWIAAALEGKLDLKICTEANGRNYIADSVANGLLLKAIVNNGKKFRNNRNRKLLKPIPEFYELYSTSQVIEIANVLERNRELSWSHSYFGEAADYWDKYLKELLDSGTSNLISNTIETLTLSYSYVDALIKDFSHVNIVNLCIGNNLAVRDMVSHVQATGKLNRFIAIDVSPDVLKVAEKNAEVWYGGKVSLEKYQMDVRYDWFGDLLAQDPMGKRADSIVNLVFIVAGPIVNFRRPDQVLFNIYDSMKTSDLLFITKKRDTEETRSFFDFNIRSDKTLTGFGRSALAKLLGIDDSYYEVEQIYDEKTKTRKAQLRLKNNISIEFNTKSFNKTIELKSGDALQLWKSTQQPDVETIEQLHGVGFDVLQTLQSKDQQLMLTVSRAIPPEITG